LAMGSTGDQLDCDYQALGSESAKHQEGLDCHGQDGPKVTRHASGLIDKISVGIHRTVATLWSANRLFSRCFCSNAQVLAWTLPPLSLNSPNL